MNRMVALAVGAAVAAGAVIWWRSGAEQRAKTAEAAAALREMVLSRRMIANLPAAPAPDAIRGVIMDWNIGGGLATLVSIDDGTVSLYLNPGGGIIGAGTHANVARVAEAFRAEAAKRRDAFKVAESYPPPGQDSITFFLLTDSATLTSGAIPTRELRQPQHALSVLETTAQQLFTAVRRAN